jgi:hypothetical protein
MSAIGGVVRGSSGSCISYDRLHLQAELSVRFPIPLSVFQCVFQFDAMALQKGIDYYPGLITQQLAQLGSRNLAFAVRFAAIPL